MTAVIVTYNNPEMLEELLKDLGHQTMRLHEIMVMDNSNSLSSQMMIHQKFPSVTYVKMSENVGTAGGFHEGIRRAIRDGEFVLTLDDDVRMRSDSVAKLYQGYIKLKKENRRLGAVRAVGACHGRSDPCRMDGFAWRGTLINAEAIRRVGLPLPEYFMYADDFEFSLQLAEHGYEAFDIPGSKIMEQRTWDKLSRRVLGRKVICYAQDFRFYYAVRNLIHAQKKHRRHCALIRTFAYIIKMLLFFGVFHRTGGGHKLRAIIRGVNDGMRTHLGKNNCYLPEMEQPVLRSSRQAQEERGGKRFRMKFNMGLDCQPLSGYMNVDKDPRASGVDVICDRDRYPGNKTGAEIWNPQEAEMPASEMARRIRDTLSYNSWYHAVKALSAKGLPVSELNLVEVGCGTGTAALTFGLLGASVTLMDSNEQVLERTRKIYDRFRCSARFIRADCLEPPPEGTTGAFDLALSSGLAEHFTGGYRQRCIDYHKALLKPGGVVMIGVPNKMSPFYQWIRGFRILTGTWELDVEVPFTNRELRALAHQSGFKKYYVLGATSLFRDAWVYSRGFVSAVADLCPGALKKAARKWKASGDDKAVFSSDAINYSVELCRAALASVESGRKREPGRMLANWLSSGLTLVAFR